MKDKAPKTNATISTTNSAEERGHGPEGASSTVSEGEISTWGGAEDCVLFTLAQPPNRYLGCAREVLSHCRFRVSRKESLRILLRVAELHLPQDRVKPDGAGDKFLMEVRG